MFVVFFVVADRFYTGSAVYFLSIACWCLMVLCQCLHGFFCAKVVFLLCQKPFGGTCLMLSDGFCGSADLGFVHHLDGHHPGG